MLRRFCVSAVVVFGLCFTASGCITAQGTKAFFAGIANDAPDPTDRADGAWDSPLKEGRGDMVREKDPDKYWGDWFMSPKAKEIERHVGIDH